LIGLLAIPGVTRGTRKQSKDDFRGKSVSLIIHVQLRVPSFITDNQHTAAVEVRDESADNEEAVKVD